MHNTYNTVTNKLVEPDIFNIKTGSYTAVKFLGALTNRPVEVDVEGGRETAHVESTPLAPRVTLMQRGEKNEEKKKR